MFLSARQEYRNSLQLFQPDASQKLEMTTVTRTLSVFSSPYKSTTLLRQGELADLPACRVLSDVNQLNSAFYFYLSHLNFFALHRRFTRATWGEGTPAISRLNSNTLLLA